jgi:streptomycin 6-kinase
MASAVPHIDAGTRQRLVARFGDGVEVWLDALPEVLAGLAERWRLALGAPIPGGSMSVVIGCRTADGRPAVLKASPNRRRMAFEAAALAGWRTRHVPAVLGVDEDAGALLIEAIEPGTPLALAGTDPGLDPVAELVRALHGSGGADPSYPPVGQHVAYLFDASTVLYERHPQLAALIPPELYERGRRLATALAADAAPTVLLHGDLTPANVLDGGAERGLVAIDPAPCVGDPALDAVDLLLWPVEEVAAVPPRISRLAALTGLDASRLLGWCTSFAAMNALDAASREADRPAHVEALRQLAMQAP